MLGLLSGAITSWGSDHSPFRGQVPPADVLLMVLLAVFCGGWLNAASNAVNQIYDLEIDRLNKPNRPLVQGRIRPSTTWILTLLGFLGPLLLTWLVVPLPGSTWRSRAFAPWWVHECTLFFLLASILTLVYSVPCLGRTKAHLWLANLTIALPRGLFLKVAGWSVLASARQFEPWYIGLCFFLFLLGASSTKDFSDMRGDQAGGVLTLPLRYGPRKAAWLIAPFLVLPWLLIPLGTLPWFHGKSLLTGNAFALRLLGLSLVLWGALVARSILRDPEELSRSENHPSWSQMYAMMIWAQLGFAISYLLP
jgi:4-hydroxybenzoate polyprenyltransferase